MVEPTAGASMIKLDDVSLTYASAQADVEALLGVSLSVAANTFVSVIGPTGCGKSSLLKLIGGLLAPSRGIIRVGGGEVGEAVRARSFGFVFQDATLLPWRSVLGNTVLLMQVAGRDAGERDRRAKDLLDMVGLSGFLRHYPRELSGGMKSSGSLSPAPSPWTRPSS